MKPTAFDAPPKGRLGLEPAIASPADLDVALRELAWIAAATKAVHAVAEREIAEVRAAAQKDLTLKVDGECVSFDARAKALDAAVRHYCESHKAEVLADGTKTRKLTHGTVSWKINPARVALGPETKPADLVAAVEKKHGLKAKIQTLLRRLLLVGKLKLDTLISFTLSPNLRAINEAWKNGELKPATLKSYGLVVVPESDNLSVDVHEYTLRAETEGEGE